MIGEFAFMAQARCPKTASPRTAVYARSTPHSTLRTRLDLPVRKQHAARWVGLGVALIGHSQIGPAYAVPSRHQVTEGVREARLAADRDSADARAGELLFIPRVALDDSGEVFLDAMTLAQFREDTPATVVVAKTIPEVVAAIKEHARASARRPELAHAS